MSQFTCDYLTNVGNNNYTSSFEDYLKFVGIKETIFVFTELQLNDFEKKSSDFFTTIYNIY